jgi:hypothetical protein
MDHYFTKKEAERVAEGRDSFSGRIMSDRQYHDVIAVTGIIERRIQEQGKYKDTKNDFVNALARTERFDVMRANTIIDDLFRIRTGMTMKQMMDGLIEKERALFNRENNPAEAERSQAYEAALEVGDMVETGKMMSVNRAYAHVAANLAGQLGITHVGAKILISESFEETEGQPLREWLKDLDREYFKPQVETERQKSAPQRTPRRQRQFEQV